MNHLLYDLIKIDPNAPHIRYTFPNIYKPGSLGAEDHRARVGYYLPPVAREIEALIARATGSTIDLEINGEVKRIIL